jgi:hypothetical protein
MQALEETSRLGYGKWLIVATSLASLALLIGLIAQSVRNARLSRRLRLSTEQARVLGETSATVEPEQPLSLRGSRLSPIDRIFPRDPIAFLMLVMALSIGCWLVGLALAPDLPLFLKSPEWLFQPFYIAAHFITLRLFINAFTSNFAAGASHLDVGEAEAVMGVPTLLGWGGALAALVIAAPFCWFDFAYLFSDRYEKMSGNEQVGTIDLVMWGIWSMEWFLNAFIWVVLVGFLVKNCVTISSYPFRAPIHTVLHDKHYRPFLQMSSQGATMVLGFSAVTVLYIWQTGGEMTDYLGLGITGALLMFGFIPPWMLLRNKVDNAVAAETARLRVAFANHARRAWPVGEPASSEALEKRLEEALALLRISYLENLYGSLGQTEAKAIMLRLLAPAATIAWQASQNFGNISERLATMLSAWLDRL